MPARPRHAELTAAPSVMATAVIGRSSLVGPVRVVGMLQVPQGRRLETTGTTSKL